MKLTVIVEDAPEGWGQNAFKGWLELLNGADLVVVNGKVTKDHSGPNVGRQALAIVDTHDGDPESFCQRLDSGVRFIKGQHVDESTLGVARDMLLSMLRTPRVTHGPTIADRPGA